MDDESPGWDAIDEVCARIYGDTKPLHYGTLVKWSLGGPDPLDGISVYPRTEPVPHWHYVSYGMTELYGKDSEDPAESGWGFEFTFRLVRDPSETEPPVWAMNFLQNLGRYVFKSGNCFEVGHHLDANGPIAAGRADSEINAVMFATDPELGEIATPHGRVQFLQVVGLAEREYDTVRRWNSQSLLDLLTPRLPLLVTDLDRTSLLSDPQIAAAVEQGIERDGSSMGFLFVDVGTWADAPDGGTVVRFGARHAPALATSLRGRLPHGRPLLIRSNDGLITFTPGDALSVGRDEEGDLRIEYPVADLDALTDVLVPRRGVRPVVPGLTVEILPTEMRDRHGDPTGEVVG